MKQFLKQDFYNLLKQAVMFYPQNMESPCKRVNSFVVLENKDQLEKDNFGINQNHIGKDFFFSRSGKDTIKNPFCFAWEQGFDISDRFSREERRSRQHCVSFEIGVLDYLETDCKNCNDCQKRTPTEIQLDCEEMVNNILDYFYNVVCVTTDGGEDKFWMNTQILDQMIVAGDIASYSIQKTETNIFRQKLKSANSNVEGSYYRHFSTKNYYGAFQVVRFCFDNCFDCNFEYEKRDYGEDFLQCC